MEKTLKEKIEKIMEWHDWAPWQFAKWLGVSKSQVTRWRAGQQIPRGETYMKICKEYEDKFSDGG